MVCKTEDATSPLILARNMRMRAEEIRTLAEEMKHDEPKAIMQRIAWDYERLVEWAEKPLRK